MDEEKSKDISGWLILVIILMLIYYNDKVSNLNEQMESLFDERSALEMKINRLNESIETAKLSTWESYEDMGYALDSLETEY